MNHQKRISRRKAIKKGVQLGMVVPFLGLGSCKTEGEKKMKEASEIDPLRILILGGTSFLGPHQIAYALSRGHSITTFTRGKTKPTVHSKLFEKVEQRIGDREDDLSALETGSWDLVIDNSGRKVEWTRDTAQLLKDRASLYLYTSSTGVYFPYFNDGIGEDTKLVLKTPENLEDEMLKMEYDYGVMKSNSELEAIKAFGKDKTIIVRPTYMMGPADRTDRFIHWPIRLAKGGEVLIPGKENDPVQYIDVRDVAEWMIRLAEQKVTGTFNAVGPQNTQSILEFVHEASGAFNTPSSFVQVDDYDFLKENDIYYIVPWIMPDTYNYGSARVDNSKAKKTGLTFRNLQDSMVDIMNWWNEQDEERRLKFENNPKGVLAREEAILQAWKGRK